MQRDWRVDTLRGWFLASMMLAHLPPHPIQTVSEYTFGYASAPDGFIFLSGMMCAWVYLNVREKRGQQAMAMRARRRALDIYLSHVGLLTLAILVVIIGRSPNLAPAAIANPGLASLSGALLLYQPRYLDILPMYAIFFIAAPTMLDQMARGGAWKLGIVSAVLWVGAQLGVGEVSRGPAWIHFGSFNIFAWQAYFVAGLYLGYRKVGSSRPVIPKSRTLLAFFAVLSLALFLERHHHFFFGTNGFFSTSAVSPQNHHPIRFLNALCLGYLLWYLPRAIDPKLINVWPFSFLNYIGRHSLQVYVFSVMITLAAFQQYAAWNGLSQMGRASLAVVAVLALAFPAWLHRRYREIRSPKLDARQSCAAA